MGLTSIFKKKKPKSMDLPPPPLPASGPNQSEHALPDLPDLEAPPAPLPDLEQHEELVAPEFPEPSYEIPAPPVQEQVIEAPPIQQEAQQEQFYPEPEPMQAPQEQIAPPEYVPQQEYHEQEIEREETGVIPKRDPVSPLFVSTNDYQTILAGIQHIRKTLGDSENIIAHLAEIKNNQEKIFSEWKTSLEDIERKIGYVDQIIVKSQEMHG